MLKVKSKDKIGKIHRRSFANSVASFYKEQILRKLLREKIEQLVCPAKHL